MTPNQPVASLPRPLDLVAGARPNFMKLAPVLRGLLRHEAIRPRVVHTGQHGDAAMSRVFFEELGLPAPQVHLDVGAGTHATQTARCLERYEGHLLATPPAATVVFGDVNGTLACALAAAKLAIPIAHVEAGLRSFDRTMPEEINRLVTDALSDLLLVTEPAGVANLAREGVDSGRIRLVGNPMVDTLHEHRSAARSRARAAALGLQDGAYCLVTMHRPANVDDPAVLRRLLETLCTVARRVPLVLPLHPRTAVRLEHLAPPRPWTEALHLLGPQSYLDHLSLMGGARLVVTDSGGMQTECAVLGVPCITLRETTEHVSTVQTGACRLVGSDPERILAAVEDALAGRWAKPGRLDLWDGRAGERCAAAIAAWAGGLSGAAGGAP